LGVGEIGSNVIEEIYRIGNGEDKGSTKGRCKRFGYECPKGKGVIIIGGCPA